ncbi:HesA/MoeB/ThiF family protein [Proteinivorax hydrogeniformans]|uniref:HesA/MoeB/ThiF family protein n=1 Tax=Proteinivorax hydrogeniformans TaxID=1826727 RepID=A0AAU8HVG4_9FIRM
MQRYVKNMNMLSIEENKKLKKFKVCVVGCGGLGGYIVEMLVRLGIGHITVVDYDKFDETNLNRQLLSDVKNLGNLKSEAAKHRAELVNPDIKVETVNKRFDSKNGEKILKEHDVVIDALDNIETRLLLQEIAKELQIPLVHGAIAGWYGQVTTILPGDDTLNRIYDKSQNKGVEEDLGNPSFTPALVASIQVSETLKLLITRGDLLRKKLLNINTFDQEYDVIQLS